MGKKGKGSKPSIENDDFGKPSEAPAGGDGWRLEHEDNIGKLFLITPLRIKDDARGFEEKIQEVIVADIVEAAQGELTLRNANPGLLAEIRLARSLSSTRIGTAFFCHSKMYSCRMKGSRGFPR